MYFCEKKLWVKLRASLLHSKYIYKNKNKTDAYNFIILINHLICFTLKTDEMKILLFFFIR